MLDAVKRYATMVLLIHLVLLVLVIFVVAGAARQVQNSAREEAQQQSKERLTLLGQQTAGGIETQYDSILSDLDVILSNDSGSTTAPASGGGTGTGGGSRTDLGGGRTDAGPLWNLPLLTVAAPAVPDGGIGGDRGGEGAAGGPGGFPDYPNRGQFPGNRGAYGQGGRGGGGRGGLGFGGRGNALGGGGRGPGRGGIGPARVSQAIFRQLWRQLRGRVSQLFVVNTNDQLIWRELNAAETGWPLSAEEVTRDNLDWLKTVVNSQMSNFKVLNADSKGAKGYHLVALQASETPSTQPAELDRLAPGGALNRGALEQLPGNRGFRGGAGRGGRGFPGRGGEGRGPPDGMPGMDGPPPPPEEMGGGFGPGDPGEGPPRIDQGPRRQPAHLVLVAVVPIDNVREFIDRLNTEQDHADSALLVNDNGDILVSKNPSTAGLNLLAQLSPELRERMNTLLTGTKTDPLVINQPYTIGSAEMPPQIMVASRLTVPSGRHWTVLISSPLSSVETLVNTIFRSALVWATVVTVSITGILLSTSFFMIRSRVRFERMRHEVLTRELQQARHIQLAWLPDTKSPPPGLEVSAANLPASHISGDFYNWFRLPQRAGAGGGAGGGEQEEAADSSRIAVVIGDVTGHGMAAAFLMATTQLLIRMTLTRYQDPGRALREVNKQLCTQSFKGQFVTMLVVVLDPAANTVEIATAGHPLPLVRTERDGGLFKELSLEPQLVLGVDPDETYTTQGFVLEPGASVLLYTDGVVEAEANSGEQYGVNRLRDLLNRNLTGTGDASAPERIRLILEDVKRFCGTRELMDDVTLVALRTTPSAVVAAAAHAARL